MITDSNNFSVKSVDDRTVDSAISSKESDDGDKKWHTIESSNDSKGSQPIIEEKAGKELLENQSESEVFNAIKTMSDPSMKDKNGDDLVIHVGFQGEDEKEYSNGFDFNNGVDNTTVLNELVASDLTVQEQENSTSFMPFNTKKITVGSLKRVKGASMFVKTVVSMVIATSIGIVVYAALTLLIPSKWKPSGRPLLYLGKITLSTYMPSTFPSASPSLSPSTSPSHIPSMRPSNIPSVSPSLHPSPVPSSSPSSYPSISPSLHPSSVPSSSPSSYPSAYPSLHPSSAPSSSPSFYPSLTHSMQPSLSTHPSNIPTRSPSTMPTLIPSLAPSKQPSNLPSQTPTNRPTLTPSTMPTASPSFAPSKNPTSPPSQTPTNRPTLTTMPTVSPSFAPSTHPSSPPSSSPTLTPIIFYVMGDVPYSAEESKQLTTQLSDIPDDARFIVHVGDIQELSGKNCTENAYAEVSQILRTSPHPTFIVPGDNDILDCPNTNDALGYWKEHFSQFEDNWQHSLPVKRQNQRKENFSFFLDDVLFIGVNLVGGDGDSEAQWSVRLADDLEWTLGKIEEFRHLMVGLVIFGHGRPKKRHGTFFHPLAEELKSFGFPSLYIHGDGHKFKLKENSFDVQNLQRVQVDRGGIAAPLRVKFMREKAIPFGNRDSEVAENPFEFLRR